MFESYSLGAVRIVTGRGPLHLETQSAAKRAFDVAAAGGTPRIIFDMDQLLLINGVCLEMLLALQAGYAAKGGGLNLVRPNVLCRDILRITGVGPRFDIYEDVASAAGSYAA